MIQTIESIMSNINETSELEAQEIIKLINEKKIEKDTRKIVNFVMKY